MNGESSNMIKSDYIPGDIIVDILSKLPAKSVLRFKIACKTWYSLISDPVFINLHCKQTSQNPKILYHKPRTKSFQLLDYESSSLNNCCLSGPIIYPGKSYNNNLNILGSSCGLVCVATNDSCGINNFTIWNPLTRECRNIPNLSIIYNIYDYFHGLGYDSVVNDFKLVISMDTITYNVFSLKANSWKTIKCPLIDSENYNSDAIQSWNNLGIFLNGIFHWLLVPASNDEEIVAFDVRNETFHKLQLPKHPCLVANILEHRGCLCVSFLKVGPDPVREIWMMKQYGSWIHLLTFKNSSMLEYLELPVIYISTRSEVVFHTDEKLSKCGKEEEDRLDENFRRHPYLYGPVLYVETLISPNAKKNMLQLNACDVYRKRKREN